ncbi:flagellar assembly protein FliX [Cohaesibacter celericrescens]|jgi:hypothetical protein|nr:flagellar assembly protein FliX [Cohaesibacter celericrescens]
MRILGGNGANQIGKASGGKRAQSTSSSFSVPQETGGAKQTSGTMQSSALHDVSSLLALQGVDDALHGRRKKAVRRGNKMLDLLEEVRMGLLAGTLPRSVLTQLERLVTEQEKSGDARIDELLSEIGLRAQVEIAKLDQNRKAMG